MNQKRILTLFSLFLGLFFVGLFLVNVNAVYTLDASNVSVTANREENTTSDFATWGDLDNWTKGGLEEQINFTLNLTSVEGDDNLTSVNITVSGGFTLHENITSVYVGLDTGINFIPVGWNVNNGSGTDNNWSVHNTSSSAISFMIDTSNATIYSDIGLGLVFQVNYSAALGVEAVYDWNITTYNNDSEITSAIVKSGIDGLPPRLGSLNVTQGTTTKTAFGQTVYLKNDTSFNITVTITDYNVDKVLLIYNYTGGSINLTNVSDGLGLAPIEKNSSGDIANYLEGLDNVTKGIDGAVIVMDNQTPTNFGATTGSTAPAYTYVAELSATNWSGSGTPFNFVFVVFDKYNNSQQINTSDANYTIVADGNDPSVSVTAPSDTTVDVSESAGITYTCTGADANGTITNTDWTLTKPSGGGTVTKTGSSATFKTTDINYAGTYSVTCKVTDAVGRTATSAAKTFTAHLSSISSSSGSAGGGGGGSGATGAATTTVDVDHDLTTTAPAEITKSQGAIVTFTLDGSSEHKITFKQVASDKVTLIFESDPVEVTLTVGETKLVDLDADGVDDVRVTLNSIENGMANVVTERVQPVVTQPSGEPVPGEVTGETTPEATPTAESGSSATTVVVIIIIVVVIIIIAVVSSKKKGKGRKGQVQI